MGRYRLAGAAAQDFDQIYDYGIDEFGLDQAMIYQNHLKKGFPKSQKPPCFIWRLSISIANTGAAFAALTRFTTASTLKRLLLCEFWGNKTRAKH